MKELTVLRFETIQEAKKAMDQFLKLGYPVEIREEGVVVFSKVGRV